MSRLELFLGVASFTEALSLDACSGPSVLLSSDLGAIKNTNDNIS